MNMPPKLAMVAPIRDLYKTDPVARRLLDNFAGRQKDSRATPASRAAWIAGAAQWEIVALFRKLQDIGAGEFKVGRRGAKTRMEWQVSIRSLGLTAQGAAGAPGPIDPESVEEVEQELEDAESDVPEADLAPSESGWIAHSFQLRPELRVTIKLPTDLSVREAERLAGFVRQVPFDE